ncbi:MAG: thiamine ABC transporter substrate binding subunit [Azospirillaceae bacterium]
MTTPMRTALLTAVAALATTPALAADLTIYTYSSFVSEWGPGPAIESGFEERCGCDIDFVSADDGVAILSRLRLEGEASPADVVLGLDTNLIAAAVAEGVVQPHGLDTGGYDLPVAWTDPNFVPFDWGYFAFVYDSQAIAEPPESLRALVEDSTAEILIQDPRTSTPGLGLLLWMRSVFGDEAEAMWTELAPRIVTVTSGWSEAYGLFLEGEAPMVLSYTTSPAYHRIAEETERYQAAVFEEGHYLQIEVAGIAAGADDVDLARDFLAYLTGPEAQAAIPTTNWMYPVVMPEGGLPEGFDAPPETPSLLTAPEVVHDNRGAWVDEWLRALSR